MNLKRNPFTNRQIPRREWFLKFTEIRNQRDRGSYWINLILSICNPQVLINTAILYSLKLTQAGYYFPFWPLVGIMVIAGILWEVLKWRIGRRDYKKWKLWELEAEWVAKNKVVAPFNIDLMADMRELCKRHGFKSHFRELNREDDKKVGGK